MPYKSEKHDTMSFIRRALWLITTEKYGSANIATNLPSEISTSEKTLESQGIRDSVPLAAQRSVCQPTIVTGPLMPESATVERPSAVTARQNIPQPRQPRGFAIPALKSQRTGSFFADTDSSVRILTGLLSSSLPALFAKSAPLKSLTTAMKLTGSEVLSAITATPRFTSSKTDLRWNAHWSI